MNHWSIWGITFVILVIATITDLKRKIIPNQLIIRGMVAFLFAHLILHPGQLPGYALTLLAFFLGMWGISILSKGGIGGGDVKLFALIGFGIGAKAAWWIFIFSHVLGGIAVLFLQLFKRMKKEDVLPFAPYMLAGFLLSWLMRLD